MTASLLKSPGLFSVFWPIIVIISFLMSSSNQCLQMVFCRNLNDQSQVYRTLLSILADFNYAVVWMVSILLLLLLLLIIIIIIIIIISNSKAIKLITDWCKFLVVFSCARPCKKLRLCLFQRSAFTLTANFAKLVIFLLQRNDTNLYKHLKVYYLCVKRQ